ncbi:hypothetical protein JCM8547_002196 [Rhodosporidiobolus lusitaniae]
MTAVPVKRSTQRTSATGEPLPPTQKWTGKKIVLFDIDNCLYSKDCGIAELMKEKIRAYFLRTGLTEEEAAKLHHHYYTEYGLAIRGLVRHHKVDPLDYDKHCDAALPLEQVLAPDKRLVEMLKSVDREKCHVWALTNAYLTHAVRVLRLVGLTEYFEGVVSCDYGAGEFSCKPEAAFFNEALSSISSPPPPTSSLYFVDDSALNIKGAHALGWGHCVLFDERGDEAVRLGGLEMVSEGKEKGKEEEGEGEAPRVSVVRDMTELRSVWKKVFKHPEANGSS